MNKALILDADGVIIKSKRYSEVYAEKYNLALEHIQPFFTGPFPDCKTGKKDLYKELAPYLEAWGAPDSVESYIEQWFSYESTIDTELTTYIKEIQKKGIVCILATDNEYYRTTYLRTVLGFDRLFDYVFSSSSLGVEKNSTKFFKNILNILQDQHTLRPENTFFFDDDPENIETAKSIGINAFVYKSISQIKKHTE